MSILGTHKQCSQCRQSLHVRHYSKRQMRNRAGRCQSCVSTPCHAGCADCGAPAVDAASEENRCGACAADLVARFGYALVRAESRQKELAIRSAMGAGRGRITVGFLTEALTLGAVGGAVGLLVAWGGVEALVATAVGILVALPCVIAYNIFHKMVEDRIADAEILGRRLADALN